MAVEIRPAQALKLLHDFAHALVTDLLSIAGITTVALMPSSLAAFATSATQSKRSFA